MTAENTQANQWGGGGGEGGLGAWVTPYTLYGADVLLEHCTGDFLHIKQLNLNANKEQWYIH